MISDSNLLSYRSVGYEGPNDIISLVMWVKKTFNVLVYYDTLFDSLDEIEASVILVGDDDGDDDDLKVYTSGNTFSSLTDALNDGLEFYFEYKFGR